VWVRAGALVVVGEPGIGKTALLEYAAGRASGCLVVRAAGVQSEMELVFAGLQQLCAPMLDHLDRLPDPQRNALRIAFGLSAGPAPDAFLVGLAVLSLLSDAAEEQPLVCLVDDEQWLDCASAQVLGFVAHRLAARADPSGAGGRIRPARRGTHLGADRGDVPAPGRGSCGRDQAVSAGRGGRSDG
jgi:hypothetical protein